MEHSCFIQLCIIWKEEITLVQQGYSSLKERPYFLPSYLINFLLSSQKIYLGSYPKSPATCSFYNLRNMAEYKDGCQVIIFLFWDISTTGVLFGDWGRENTPTWHCGIRVGDFATTWRTTLGQWEEH